MEIMHTLSLFFCFLTVKILILVSHKEEYVSIQDALQSFQRIILAFACKFLANI